MGPVFTSAAAPTSAPMPRRRVRADVRATRRTAGVVLAAHGSSRRRPPQPPVIHRQSGT